jgi:tRNA threonylcarbamoyl adenosine modification protein YeaZ
MRTLVIETASEACSVALFEDSALVAHDHRMLGRGHAERLVPMIAELPDKGKADRILVSLGPGSFTGVRIGVATARALGFAWGAKVRGYPTLALVAVLAQETRAVPVTVCMNGGHGEFFVQNFTPEGPEDEVQSLTPAQAVLACRYTIIVGNRAQHLLDILDRKGEAIDLLPDARAAIKLAPHLLTRNLSPRYGREPDAKPQSLAPSPSGAAA